MTTETEFMELVQANRGIIAKVVGLYANSEEERKDLFQEILFQAWKGFAAFRGEARFSTWLYRISLNTILTAHRKVNKVEYRETLEDNPVWNDGGEQQNREHSRMLRAVIRRLPETERAIITLHLDGYSNPEIAEIMGISANNATVKLHRIKNQLITKLQPQLS